MQFKNFNKINWILVTSLLIVIISVLHFNTPTEMWHYHLVYMQCYFIPIVLGAFRFGVKGGLGTAIVISLIYLPHIMFQHGGLIETNLMRFLQIALFNIIGYLIGIKAQKESEEKTRYKNAADKLEKSLKTVKDQSNKLHELEDQLRQVDRLSVIGELTASLAHEIRNPLGSIRGAVEILRDGVQDENRKSEFFQILIDDTERMNTILENYLNYSKRKKQRDSEYIIQEKRIDLELEIPGDPVRLRGDPNDLWQILMNLILNAIQAIDSGGKIKINIIEEILTSEKKMYYNIEDTSQNYLILIISDNGPGIPDKEKIYIFKPFYSTKASGSGLGLAIVKRIVDNNHWIINVNSELGTGTEFVVIIPIKI